MEKSERKRMWIFDIEFFASFEVTMILTFSADPSTERVPIGRVVYLRYPIKGRRQTKKW